MVNNFGNVGQQMGAQPFFIRMKTTNGFRPVDPRAAFDHFILEIGGIEIKTDNTAALWRPTGGAWQPVPGDYGIKTLKQCFLAKKSSLGTYRFFRVACEQNVWYTIKKHETYELLNAKSFALTL